MREKKVLTIVIEFELDETAAYRTRLKAAYENAVSAAASAVRGELLGDGLKNIRSRVLYDYRQFESGDLD
jgi:hypothetical protein